MQDAKTTAAAPGLHLRGPPAQSSKIFAISRVSRADSDCRTGPSAWPAPRTSACRTGRAAGRALKGLRGYQQRGRGLCGSGAASRLIRSLSEPAAESRAPTGCRSRPFPETRVLRRALFSGPNRLVTRHGRLKRAGSAGCPRGIVFAPCGTSLLVFVCPGVLTEGDDTRLARRVHRSDPGGFERLQG